MYMSLYIFLYLFNQLCCLLPNCIICIERFAPLQIWLSSPLDGSKELSARHAHSAFGRQAKRRGYMGVLLKKSSILLRNQRNFLRRHRMKISRSRGWKSNLILLLWFTCACLSWQGLPRTSQLPAPSSHLLADALAVIDLTRRDLRLSHVRLPSVWKRVSSSYLISATAFATAPCHRHAHTPTWQTN